MSTLSRSSRAPAAAAARRRVRYRLTRRDPAPTAANPTARGLPVQIIVHVSGRVPVVHTLGAIARASGLTHAAVSRIFNKQRPGRVDSLERIAAALRVPTITLHTFLAARR